MTEQELFEKGYEVKDGVLISYRGNETSVVLPFEISVVGKECFAFNENLISFTASVNLKSIEKHAFHACKNLKFVKLNEGIESIDEFAFCSSGVSEIVIPNTVTMIGDKAFRCCDSLKKVVLPEKLKSISNNLFDCCHKLEDVKLPEELIDIGSEAFTMCYNLKKLVIPKTVKKIGDNAFGCDISQLQIEFQCSDYKQEGVFVFGPDYRLIRDIGNKTEKEIIIPDGTKVIGAYVFDRWIDIENVIFPKSLVRIDETAFLNSMENLNVDCQKTIKSFYMAQANEKVQNGKRKIYMS